VARHHGFVDSNLLVFNAVSALGVRVAHYGVYRNVAAPLDEIQALLRDGAAVLAEVDFRPGGSVQMHWVRLFSVDEDDGWVMDPWLPEENNPVSLMMRYALPQWDSPARALFRVVAYQPVPKDDVALSFTAPTFKAMTQEKLDAAPWVTP